ncbi:MAG: sulfotransferase family protein [Cyanobacteria bacterium P01_G01_bin.38]
MLTCVSTGKRYISEAQPMVASLMASRLTQLRQQVRVSKNDWIQRYFKWRIESASAPYRVALRPKPYRFLLVLSHMRSGSSLLTHLLSANPDVIGYGETHIEYAGAADFKQLLQRVYWQAQEFRSLGDIQNLRMNHLYAMDKVLHDKKFLSRDFLADEQVYGLFLLREPSRSLASIADLKPHWSEADTLSYYTGRLATLVEYARLIDNPARTLVVTYEQLLNQTAEALTTLQQFLQTPTSFSEEYQVMKTTGMKGVGDSKGKIKAGKIVRSQRQLQLNVSSNTLTTAKAAYQSASEQLMKICTRL